MVIRYLKFATVARWHWSTHELFCDKKPIFVKYGIPNIWIQRIVSCHPISYRLLYDIRWFRYRVQSSMISHNKNWKFMCWYFYKKKQLLWTNFNASFIFFNNILLPLTHIRHCSWFTMSSSVRVLPFDLLSDSPNLLLCVQYVFRNVSMTSDSFHLRMGCEFLFQSFCIVQSSSFTWFQLENWYKKIFITGEKLT